MVTTFIATKLRLHSDPRWNPLQSAKASPLEFTLHASTFHWSRTLITLCRTLKLAPRDKLITQASFVTHQQVRSDKVRSEKVRSEKVDHRARDPAMPILRMCPVTRPQLDSRS